MKLSRMHLFAASKKFKIPTCLSKTNFMIAYGADSRNSIAMAFLAQFRVYLSFLLFRGSVLPRSKQQSSLFL
jgi:hypothetical protein